jgi:hypothetical protein
MREDLVATRKHKLAASGSQPMTDNQILLLRNKVVKLPVDGRMIKNGVQNVIKYMAPVKALAKQHAWMRCYCHKPQDMTMKVYLNHLYSTWRHLVFLLCLGMSGVRPPKSFVRYFLTVPEPVLEYSEYSGGLDTLCFELEQHNTSITPLLIGGRLFCNLSLEIGQFCPLGTKCP